MRWREVAVAAALVGIVGVDTGLVVFHDRATPYDAEQALTDFRAQAGADGSVPASTAPGSPSPTASPAERAARAAASTVAAPPTPGASLPPSAVAAPVSEVTPGVYRYATSGHEQVDVLGGARHDYPAETAMTYRRSGCGSEDRWQPLKERYSLNTLCRSKHGLEAGESIQRREFFGQSEEQVLVCAPGLVIVPTRPRPGDTSAGSCKSDDTVVRLTVKVVDLAEVTVGGRRVASVHVHVDGRLTGSTRGSTSREEWFTSSGLLLRGTASTETDRDTSAGVVHYSETYDIRLESLDPQR
jgi:hypothetical protein